MFGVRAGCSHLALIRSCLRMASSATARKLEGKVAIVTASTDGIGFAIARRLGLDGATVVVSSRKQKNVDDAVSKLEAENISVRGMVCHVAKPEHRRKLIEQTSQEFGGFDILVSNAGINPHFGSVLTVDETQWDKIFETNVKASFFLIKEAVPHIEKKGGGSIIVVSSITGYNAFPLIGAYSISKTALLGMVKALAMPCGAMNIRVNAIAPGIIDTHFSKSMVTNPMISERFLEQLPLGRFGKPEDCVGAVSFLVSDDAQYITGETLLITGGAHARL